MRFYAPMLLCAVLATSGCGAATRPVAGARGVATTTTAPAGTPGARAATDAEVRSALHLPARVPLRPTGGAPAEQVAVVRGWLDDLRHGNIRSAANRFAVPSRFQNFTALALIRSRAQAVAITDSLPCGARMTHVGAAAGFVVYEARLTDRPGGACGAGTGGVVRGAVLVRAGHMVEWYRLPDRSRPRHGEPAIPSGPLV